MSSILTFLLHIPVAIRTSYRPCCFSCSIVKLSNANDSTVSVSVALPPSRGRTVKDALTRIRSWYELVATKKRTRPYSCSLCQHTRHMCLLCRTSHESAFQSLFMQSTARQCSPAGPCNAKIVMDSIHAPTEYIQYASDYTADSADHQSRRWLPTINRDDGCRPSTATMATDHQYATVSFPSFQSISTVFQSIPTAYIYSSSNSYQLYKYPHHFKLYLDCFGPPFSIGVLFRHKKRPRPIRHTAL